MIVEKNVIPNPLGLPRSDGVRNLLAILAIDICFFVFNFKEIFTPLLNAIPLDRKDSEVVIAVVQLKTKCI